MKYRIFILPLLLGSVSASAYELEVYYDVNGNYDTFCSVPHHGNSDCPSPITAEAIAEKFMDIANNRDEVFSGFTLPDGTVLMDSTGDLKLTGRQVNAKGLDSTVTLRTNNACQTGSRKNTKDVCVNSETLDNPENENVAYIDWTSVLNNTNGDSGYEINASQIKDNGGKDCYYDRDFDIVIHWCPKNYSAIDYSYGGAHIAYGNNPVDWSALPCNQSTETYHYHWNGGTSLGTYTKNNVTQTEIVFPSATGWSPRGLYIVGYPEFKPNDNSFNNIPYYSLLKTIADNFVTEQSTTWGRARLGLPFNQLGVTDRIILNNKVNGYGDANANWQIWTCNGDIETVHMYAAWARDCGPGSGATCSRQIYRHGLSNPDKGDVVYTTSCTSGQTPANNNAYNPSCGICSESNPTQCDQTQCNNLTNAHWCVVGGAGQCSSRNVTRGCCVDDLSGCDSKGCNLMGGTWNENHCYEPNEYVYEGIVFPDAEVSESGAR